MFPGLGVEQFDPNVVYGRRVRMLMARAEEQTGLKLVWLRDPKDIAQAGKEGLFSLYCDVFAEPPYEEKFTPTEVQKDFETMLRKGGLVFIAKTAKKGGAVVAFVAATPLIKNPSVVEAVRPYLDISAAADFNKNAVRPDFWSRVSRTIKTFFFGSSGPYDAVRAAAYFNEDGVRSDFRRRGISRAMKQVLLGACNASGCDTMVLRTSADSFNQAAACIQLGARQIPDLSQDVESLKLDGTITPDKRVFFTFDLAKYR